jgi:alkenylglycerophosphocholine/alkenylglycerophosphoethanolamine hydrolase
MPAGLVLFGLLGAAGFLWMDGQHPFWFAVLLKPIPVLTMAGAQLWARPERHPGWMVLGLLLSAVGDVLLELPGDLFVPGLVAFLLAHCAYVVHFWVRRPVLAPVRAIPFLLFGMVMFAWLAPGLGALALPVGLYAFVLSTMAWRASALVGRGPPVAAWLALGGALLFVTSDALLAANRFQGPVPYASLLVILTYWLGQLGLSSSTIVDD